MDKEKFELLIPYDTPLRQSILKIPPLASNAAQEQDKLVCQGENFKVSVQHYTAWLHWIIS